MHATEHTDFDFSGLTNPERIDLAQKLWESIWDQIEATPLSETEVAETRWRIDQINAGLMVCERIDAVIPNREVP